MIRSRRSIQPVAAMGDVDEGDHRGVLELGGSAPGAADGDALGERQRQRLAIGEGQVAHAAASGASLAAAAQGAALDDTGRHLRRPRVGGGGGVDELGIAAGHAERSEHGDQHQAQPAEVRTTA